MSKDKDAAPWEPKTELINLTKLGPSMSNEQKEAAMVKNAENMIKLQAELDYRETLPPRKRHFWQLD